MNFNTRIDLISGPKIIVCCFLILMAGSFEVAAAPVAFPTPEPTVKTLKKQAAKFVKHGQYDDAENSLIRALEKDPLNTETKLDLAFVHLKQRRLNDAYSIAFPIAEADPKNSFAFAIVGTVFLAAGQFDQARLILNTALTLNKREALAWASLGMLEFYENKVDKSLEYLREAVSRDGSEPDYVFSLGQVAARAENFREAAIAYRKFLAISPDDDDERRDRIIGLIEFLDYIGGRSSLYSTDGSDETSVPITFINQRPIIKLKINGRDQPLNFVLDTGSGISIISERTAKELGIDPVTHGGLGKGLGGDGSFEIIFGFVDKIAIGDVIINNIPICIRKFHSRSDAVDGYIGLSLISKFLTTIDYGAGTLVLKKPVRRDEKEESQIRPIDNDELELPLLLTSSGFLSGKVVLAEKAEPLNFIVDTGASITVLSKELMTGASLREIDQQGTVRVVGAAGITHGVPSYTVPSVKFGSNVQTDVDVVALDLGIINQSAGYVQSGILGGNFLSKYKVTFDFQRSKVKLSPIISEVTVDPAPLVQ